MILYVSGATRFARSESVGHLIVPKQWNDPATLDLREHALDNGAFSGFDAGAFMRMLEAYHPYQRYHAARFVVAPDVVADAAATLKLWPFWSRLIRGLGFPPAFVAQDGIQSHRVPWDEMSALFIGGSTKFKESADARSLCAYANGRGIWTHWGRVNGKRRYELALKAGVNSIDGTGFSMFPDTNIPKVDRDTTAARVALRCSVTPAETARRRMFGDYSRKAGKASGESRRLGYKRTIRKLSACPSETKDTK